MFWAVSVIGNSIPVWISIVLAELPTHGFLISGFGIPRNRYARLEVCYFCMNCVR